MVRANLHCGCGTVHPRHDLLHLIILPPAFEWLTDQASGFATIMPEASRWVDIIIKFEIGFGFGFELPLIVFYLVMFNIISYDKLRKSWRYVYISLLILSLIHI